MDPPTGARVGGEEFRLLPRRGLFHSLPEGERLSRRIPGLGHDEETKPVCLQLVLALKGEKVAHSRAQTVRHLLDYLIKAADTKSCPSISRGTRRRRSRAQAGSRRANAITAPEKNVRKRRRFTTFYNLSPCNI